MSQGIPKLDKENSYVVENKYGTFYKKKKSDSMVLQLHKVGSPAAIWKNGLQEYYFEGKLHNAHGPAVIKPNGEEEYWIGGVQYIESVSLTRHGIIINSKFFTPKIALK